MPAVFDREFVRRPGELAALRVIDLQPLHVVLEYINRFSSTMLVAVPEQPLDPFQISQQPFTHRLIMVSDTTCVLFQHGHAHRDVEPIQDVLGCRSDAFGFLV